MTTSPPKPWERQAAESKVAAAAAATAADSDTAANAAVGSVSSATAALPGNTPMVPNRPQAQPITPYSSNAGYPQRYGRYSGAARYASGPVYGGYGGAGYGAASSMYGGGYTAASPMSMYGGGYGTGYGSSMYGGGSSMYGGSSSMYGGGYESYGGGIGKPVGPHGNSLIQGGHSFIEGVHQHVSSFGRFAEILQMNFEALHMSFSSLLHLVTNASILKQEFGSIFSAFGSLRLLYVLFRRVKAVVLRLLGRSQQATHFEMDGVWSDARHGRYGWLSTLLAVSVTAFIAKHILAFLSRPRPPSPSASPLARQWPAPQRPPMRPPQPDYGVFQQAYSGSDASQGSWLG